MVDESVLSAYPRRWFVYNAFRNKREAGGLIVGASAEGKNSSAVLSAADFNTGLISVTDERKALTAAAAIMSLTLDSEGARQSVEAELVRLQREGKAWVARAVKELPVFGDRRSSGVSVHDFEVELDSEGECKAAKHRSRFIPHDRGPQDGYKGR